MKWTIDEENILIDNFKRCSYRELSILSNKSEGSVKGKLERMKLTHRKMTKWTTDEDEYMVANYGILPPNEIAVVLGRSTSSVTMRAITLGVTNKYLHKHSTPNYNIDFFREWSSDLAWLVGIVLSDGHISNIKLSAKYVRVKMCDPDVIYKIKDMIRFQGNVGVFTPKDGCKTSYSITIGGREVWEFFTCLGMNHSKSYTAKFPTEVPREHISHLIRGIFDGDGSISVYKGKYLYCRICGTEAVVMTTQSVVGKHSTIHHNKTKTSFVVQYTGKIGIDFMEYIYKDSYAYNRMDRKYNIYKEYVK